MSWQSLTTFSRNNRRLILILIMSHLLWCLAVLGLWSFGQLVTSTSLWWPALFLFLQLYGAAQLLLPALLLHPERRERGFYLMWGLLLGVAVWLINLWAPDERGLPWLMILKSGLLLLVATFVGAVLARYVRRLWELLPVCLVMSLADFASWSAGPTAGFARQIESYYRKPVGPPPLVDMVLIKLTLPGASSLVPVFGISDWIMVAFFSMVASRHVINDNLLRAPGLTLARYGRFGCYLPVAVVALLSAILLAQVSGRFVPVLPVIALVMLLWYSLKLLFVASRR
mgnify:CR=1 FL=1